MRWPSRQVAMAERHGEAFLAITKKLRAQSRGADVLALGSEMPWALRDGAWGGLVASPAIHPVPWAVFVVVFFDF